MRLFVAVYLPEEIRGHLAEHTRRAPALSSLKWVPQDQWHITLKFMGAAEESKLLDIQSVLKAVIPTHHAMKFQLEKGGAFPLKEAPRVFWTGIVGDLSPLKRLAERIENRLTPLGYPPENRKFKPHVTLGRAVAQGALVGAGAGESAPEAPSERAQFAHYFSTYQSPEFTVREIHLVQSHLKPAGGSTYEVLQTYSLKSH